MSCEMSSQCDVRVGAADADGCLAVCVQEAVELIGVQEVVELRPFETASRWAHAQPVAACIKAMLQYCMRCTHGEPITPAQKSPWRGSVGTVFQVLFARVLRFFVVGVLTRVARW